MGKSYENNLPKSNFWGYKMISQMIESSLIHLNDVQCK